MFGYSCQALNNTFEGIEKVLNLVSMSMGDDVLLAFKVRMNHHLQTKELVETINMAERSLKENFPEINWLFVEPDIEK